ncbi:Ig-like domain-containing protein [Paraburkholderia sp. WC7.3g]|uniref:Ig-like domain-containing protein n=1 Tax=Paraburkholderia sp. WC7.3g TaxID=2991070 RepID=UPI003D195B8F
MPDVPDTPSLGEVIDHVGPIQGPVGNGESTDDTMPTLVGKGEPGDTIIVIDNGTPIGETKVDEEGNWSFTPETPLDEGQHEFTLVERDPAGNESKPSDPWTVIVDTTPPDTPSLGEVIDHVGPIQGPVGNGESTDDTQPTLVGKGEPGDTIIVIDNGTPIGETKVDEEGNWSFTPETPLDEGGHEFTLVERDPAGNESKPSDPWTVIVDTTPPDTPSIGEVIDHVGPIQGPVGNGESTDDTQPTLVGKGEPGDTIIVIDNGTPIGETKVDEEGNWSFTPETPLDEGQHEFTLVERDPAGNESKPSDPWTVIVDTTPPDTPSLGEVIDHVGPIQGPVGNGESTDDTQPTLVGKGEPGDTIIVIDNGTPIGETKVDEEGNWSFTPETPLDEGGHEFTLVERDPAGNESKPSDPWTVIVDTTPPDTPSIGEVIDHVGPIQGPVGNGESTDDTMPTLVGKGDPGDTIIVIDNGTPIGETKVDEEGNWSFTPETPLDEGGHEFMLVERDPAGNESKPSDPWTVIVDTTPPDTPSLGEVIDHVGPIQGPVGNGESTDDTQPTLVGKGEPGDTIIVIDNGKPIGETKVDEDGNWSFTPETPLDEGQHEFTLVERDPAGNESKPSDPWTVIVDTTPPDTPSIGEVIDHVGPIQGPVGNGENTDDPMPTLVGKGDPGDTIIVIDNGKPIGETEVDEEGNWSFTPETPLGEGQHEFTVVERDPAGNESKPSDPWTVIVHTTVPDAPVIIEVIDDQGTEKGPIGQGKPTDDAQPEIRGTAEPGSTVTIFDGGQVLGQTKADDNGNWSFTPETPLDEGNHNLTAVATNEVGTSEPSGQFGFSLLLPGHYELDFSNSTIVGLSRNFHNAGDRHTVKTVSGLLRIGTQITNAVQDATSVLYYSIGDSNNRPTAFSVDFDQIDPQFHYTVRVIVHDTNGAYGNSELLTIFNLNDQGANHIEMTLPEGYTLVRLEIAFDNASPGFDITGTSYYTAEYQPVTGESDVLVDEVAVSEIQDIEDSSDADADVPADSGVDDQKLNDSESALDSDEQSVGVTSTEGPDTVLDLQGIEYSTSVYGDIHTESGVDVLTLTGSGLVLDLTNVEEKLSSIEVFDITGTGNNTLKLSLGDVLDLGATDLFVADGHTQLMVKGDAGDKVELSDLLPDGEDPGDWAQESGTTTVGGVEYDVFYHSGLNAELLVQHGVETTLNNH